MAKFEQQQVLGSISNPYTGLAQGKMAVADVLQGFGKWGMEQHRQKRLQTTAEEAQAVEPSTQAPELRTQMTETGRAYNEIVLAGHAAAIKNDYTKRIGELTVEYQNDPEGFDRAAAAYRDEMSNHVDPTIRNDIINDYNYAIIRPSTTIRDTFQKNQVIDSANKILASADTILNDAASAARAGDIGVMNHNMEAVNRLAETLTEMGRADLASKLTANMSERIDKQIVLGQAEDAIQAGGGAKFIQNFIDNPPADLSPEQVDSYAATMVTMDNRYQALIKEQQVGMSIEQQREISNIQIQAKNGLGDPEQIMGRTEELFSQGHISLAQRTSIFNDLMAADKKRMDEAQSFESVNARLNGNDAIFVDPKVQDKYFEQNVLPALANMDPMQREAMTVEYIDRMKRVPTALKNQLQTFVMSENPDLIRQAANLVDKVDQIPGLVGAVFTPEQEAFMTQTVALMENLAPTEAVQLARQLTDPNNSARVEARSQELKQLQNKTIGGLDYRGDAEDIFNPIFGGTQVGEVVADQITREYKTLVDSYYMAGMSMDDAKAKAEKMINRDWSVWNDRAMKYSPAQYYSVAGSTDYILDQLYSDVTKEVVTDEPIRKKDLMLISTEETARTASTGQPVYRVAVVKDGSITPLHGFYWQPDTERETKRVERANRAELEAIQQEENVPIEDIMPPLKTGRSY